MENQLNNSSLPDILEPKPENDSKTISWKTNGAYKIWFYLRRFFENPFKERKHELDILEQVDILIQSGDLDKVSDTCKQYIGLHRIVENTRARRRLERWITRLVAFYLIVVFAILTLDSIKLWFDINDKVMITILSTTTINIVALGIILVRGLFHEDEKKDIGKENPFNHKEDISNEKK